VPVISAIQEAEIWRMVGLRPARVKVGETESQSKKKDKHGNLNTYL
jgi:hypothetical protein